MPLTQERKQELITQFGHGTEDTGRTEVQVALLTERINELTDHLREPSQGPPQPPWPADVGWLPPSLSELSAADRSRALPSLIGQLGLRR